METRSPSAQRPARGRPAYNRRPITAGGAGSAEGNSDLPPDMNRRTILTKTGKGLMEATGKSSNLSRDLRDILKEIDGTVSVSELLKKFEEMSEREIGEALRGLVRDGYVREFIGQQDAAPRAPTGRSPTPPASAGAGEDLDFTDFTPA